MSDTGNQKNPIDDLDVIHNPLQETLDFFHHDLPERHRFGLAFHAPVDPQPIGTVAFPGVSDTPAREDHVHTSSISTDPPYLAARRNTNVSIGAAVFTLIPLDTLVESNIPNSEFTFTGGGITVNKAGYYIIRGYCSLQSAVAGAARGYTCIFAGGNVLARSAYRPQDTAWSSQVSYQGWLAAGTGLTLQVW